MNYDEKVRAELRAAQATLDQANRGEKGELSLPDLGGLALDVLVARAALGYKLIVRTWHPRQEVEGVERLGPPKVILRASGIPSYPELLRFYFGNALNSPGAPYPALLPVSRDQELALVIRDGISSLLDPSTDAGRLWREHLENVDETAVAISRAIVRTWWESATPLPDVSELPSLEPYMKAAVEAFEKEARFDEWVRFGDRADWD